MQACVATRAANAGSYRRLFRVIHFTCNNEGKISEAIDEAINQTTTPFRTLIGTRLSTGFFVISNPLHRK